MRPTRGGAGFQEATDLRATHTPHRCAYLRWGDIPKKTAFFRDWERLEERDLVHKSYGRLGQANERSVAGARTNKAKLSANIGQISLGAGFHGKSTVIDHHAPGIAYRRSHDYQFAQLTCSSLRYPTPGFTDHDLIMMVS